MTVLVNKISINIKVVGLNVEHNFLVPREMAVGDAVDLICKALSDEYPGVNNRITQDRMLMRCSSGKMLNRSCSFKQLGIIQGERMILI